MIKRGTALNWTVKVMETYGNVDKVFMKLACGPVTEHTDGIIERTEYEGNDTTKPKVTKYCQKTIILHAQYGKPEDNSFATATPSAKLEMTLQNPNADIFRPGKLYKVTIEPWVD